jgi:hypothetical protein
MKNLLILLVLIISFQTLYSQQYKYENWPLQDNSKDIRDTYGERTISKTSTLHDGIDIYGIEKTVVSARKGKFRTTNYNSFLNYPYLNILNYNKAIYQ